MLKALENLEDQERELGVKLQHELQARDTQLNDGEYGNARQNEEEVERIRAQIEQLGNQKALLKGDIQTLLSLVKSLALALPLDKLLEVFETSGCGELLRPMIKSRIPAKLLE